MLCRNFNDLVKPPEYPPFMHQFMAIFNRWAGPDLKDILHVDGVFRVHFLRESIPETYEYYGPNLENNSQELTSGLNKICFSYVLNLHGHPDEPDSVSKLVFSTYYSPEIWLLRTVNKREVWFDNETEYQMVRNLMVDDHVME
jgi:hypothetical protein